MDHLYQMAKQVTGSILIFPISMGFTIRANSSTYLALHLRVAGLNSAGLLWTCQFYVDRIPMSIADSGEA